MCLQHPCYESLNRFTATKPARIMFGVLMVLVVAVGCYRLLNTRKIPANKAKFQLLPKTENNFIHFNATDDTSYKQITSEIDNVFDFYRKTNTHLIKCNDDIVRSDKPCAVQLDNFGPCTPDNNYGYSSAKPCVFLKVSKIRNWTPQIIDLGQIPEHFSQYMVEVIRSDRNLEKKLIWFTCDGENEDDIQNVGPISYYPGIGIRSYYFPYTGQHDYLGPMIAVNFESPKRKVAISVKCTMWTQNLQESIIFKLFVE